MIRSDLPQPAHQYRMTYCDRCFHVRADHVEDGPCAYVSQWPGVLVGCGCPLFARRVHR